MDRRGTDKTQSDMGGPKVLDSKLFRLTARASMVLEKGVGREALDEVNSGTS